MVILEHTCARSCFRRGLADARMVRLLLSAFKTGRSRGSGLRKIGALGFGGGI